MNTGPKQKPAWRVRYEATHPTVSCRVPKDLYDKLETLRAATRRSFAHVLKAGLGVLKDIDDKLAAARSLGFQQGRAEAERLLDEATRVGYQAGYADAESTFKVLYPCGVCGKPIELQSEEAKKAASKYMVEHGWGHASCHRNPQAP